MQEKIVIILWIPTSGALREKCPYFELFWFVSSPNAGKYGPE